MHVPPLSVHGSTSTSVPALNSLRDRRWSKCVSQITVSSPGCFSITLIVIFKKFTVFITTIESKLWHQGSNLEFLFNIVTWCCHLLSSTLKPTQQSKQSTLKRNLKFSAIFVLAHTSWRFEKCIESFEGYHFHSLQQLWNIWIISF